MYGPEYTDLNGDDYPDILFTLGGTESGNIILVALDGLTKDELWRRDLGSYPILQFITFKLNNQTKIAFRRQNAVYIYNNLGQPEGEPIVLDSTVYPFDPYYPYGYLVATNINGRAVLIVGMVMEKSWGKFSTDICIVDLNGTLDTQNTWPMDGCDQEGTRCLDLTKDSSVPPEDSVVNHPDKNSVVNYPNPFGIESGTTIMFTVPAGASQIDICIFNIIGQKVREYSYIQPNKGICRVTWDGKNQQSQDVVSGIYFCRFFSNKTTQTKKMVLIR